MAQEEKRWVPENQINLERPLVGTQDPLKNFGGIVPPVVRDRSEKAKTNRENFKPEGSVEVPLVACAISTDKKEMAYVDTLAMQTKLGAMQRQGEESMRLRDSEIVKTRSIGIGTTVFSGIGGTTKIADSAMPQAIMGGRGPAMLTPIVPPSVVPLAPPYNKTVGPAPSLQNAYVEEVRRKAEEAKAKVTVVLPPQSSSEAVRAARQKLDEIRAKVNMPLPRPISEEERKAVEVAVKQLIDQATATAQAAVEAGEAKLEEVKIEPVMPVVVPVVKHEPIIVQPLEDQSGRILELESENASLISIVSRLAAENKALKAKK